MRSAPLLLAALSMGCVSIPAPRPASASRARAAARSLAPSLTVGERYRLEVVGYVAGPFGGTSSATDAPLGGHRVVQLEVVAVEPTGATLRATLEEPQEHAGSSFLFEVAPGRRELVVVDRPAPLDLPAAEEEALNLLERLAPRPATAVRRGDRWRVAGYRCRYVGARGDVARMRAARSEWTDESRVGIVLQAQSELSLDAGLSERTTRSIALHVERGDEHRVVTYREVISITRVEEPRVERGRPRIEAARPRRAPYGAS